MLRSAVLRPARRNRFISFNPAEGVRAPSHKTNARAVVDVAHNHVGGMRFHDLRHSYGSSTTAYGLTSVQRVLGHESHPPRSTSTPGEPTTAPASSTRGRARTPTDTRASGDLARGCLDQAGAAQRGEGRSDRLALKRICTPRHSCTATTRPPGPAGSGGRLLLAVTCVCALVVVVMVVAVILASLGDLGGPRFRSRRPAGPLPR